jgi:hypothetical protein
MLDAAPDPRFQGKIRGLIVPHAGYVYSGPTAAHAYALVRGHTVETVVVISPSHRDYFEGVSVYPGDAYETPLGLVPVNAGLRDVLLRECPVVHASMAGHADEHALEVQLPFLQEALGTFSLLPLVIGNQVRDTCFTLGRALGRILDREATLLVASTDLSHFHPSSVARRLDQVVIDDLQQFDADRLMTDLESNMTEACGGGPTVALLVAAQAMGATHVRVLHHTDSGTITGDTHSVVGYLAAVAYGEAPTAS